MIACLLFVSARPFPHMETTFPDPIAQQCHSAMWLRQKHYRQWTQRMFPSMPQYAEESMLYTNSVPGRYEGQLPTTMQQYRDEVHRRLQYFDQTYGSERMYLQYVRGGEPPVFQRMVRRPAGRVFAYVPHEPCAVPRQFNLMPRRPRVDLTALLRIAPVPVPTTAQLHTANSSGPSSSTAMLDISPASTTECISSASAASPSTAMLDSSSSSSSSPAAASPTPTERIRYVTLGRACQMWDHWLGHFDAGVHGDCKGANQTTKESYNARILNNPSNPIGTIASVHFLFWQQTTDQQQTKPGSSMQPPFVYQVLPAYKFDVLPANL